MSVAATARPAAVLAGLLGLADIGDAVVLQAKRRDACPQSNCMLAVVDQGLLDGSICIMWKSLRRVHPMCLAVLHGACSSSGSQEEDLFITRAVLQILASASSASSSKQLQHAQQLLGSYQQQWGLPDAPLVNFAKLLLQVSSEQCMLRMPILNAEEAFLCS